MRFLCQFDSSKGRAYLVSTSSGPAIRWWEPSEGWHFAALDEDHPGSFEKGDPCDYRVINSVIKQF